jgi:hypothetical protein
MALRNTPKSYKSAKDRGLKDNEHANRGNGRVFVDAPPGYKKAGGKTYMDGRYAYRYAVEAWRKTGRVANPKKEIVHHLGSGQDTGKFSRKKDRKVGIELRSKHYRLGHGRPFSRAKPRSL